MNYEQTAKAIAAAFPSNHADLDRELARTLGMLAHDDGDLRGRVLARCDADSSPADDVHFLACYALLAGKRDESETKRVAVTLLDLDRKITTRKMNRDSNWQPRVRELYVGLAQKDAGLHKAMVEHADFGRPDHALFANVDGFPKVQAARVFLGRWQREKNYALTGAVVQLFDALPPGEVLPIAEAWATSVRRRALAAPCEDAARRGSRQVCRGLEFAAIERDDGVRARAGQDRRKAGRE